MIAVVHFHLAYYQVFVHCRRFDDDYIPTPGPLYTLELPNFIRVQRMSFLIVTECVVTPPKVGDIKLSCDVYLEILQHGGWGQNHWVESPKLHFFTLRASHAEAIIKQCIFKVPFPLLSYLKPHIFTREAKIAHTICSNRDMKTWNVRMWNGGSLWKNSLTGHKNCQKNHPIGEESEQLWCVWEFHCTHNFVPGDSDPGSQGPEVRPDDLSRNSPDSNFWFTFAAISVRYDDAVNVVESAQIDIPSFCWGAIFTGVTGPGFRNRPISVPIHDFIRAEFGMRLT